MKYMLLVAVTVASLASQAALIRGARIDASGKNLLIDVRYGGGCGKHDFSLDLQGCAESMPVQCMAKLVHKTADFCEALISTTVSLNLDESGIKGSYYSEGSLQIYSDMNDNDKFDRNEEGIFEETSAVVYLPVMSGEDSKMDNDAATTSTTTCTTHTGSKLQFFEVEKELQLTSKEGAVHIFEITNKDYLFLESNPPQLKTNYSLEDGRTVVTMFTDGRANGTGYFIRLDGSASPTFTCQRNTIGEIE